MQPVEVSFATHPLAFLAKNVQWESVPANTRYSIASDDLLFLTQSEGGDVFALYPHLEGEPPIYLGQVQPNSLFLGGCLQTEKRASQYFFIASAPVQIGSIPIQTLTQQLQAHPENKAEFAKLLDQWIYPLLLLFLQKTEGGSLERAMKTEKEEANAQEALRLRHSSIPEEKERLSWAEVLKGRFHLDGESSFRLPEEKGVLYPLSQQLWVVSEEDGSRIFCKKTEEVLDLPGFWKGVVQFQKDLFQVLERNREREIQKAIVHIETKKKIEKGLVGQSMVALGSVLNDQIPFLALHEEDPIYQACSLVAQAFRLPARKMQADRASLSADEKVKRFAQTMHLGYRRVLFHKGWSSQAMQPIVAFYQEEPVVLFPKNAREYQMIHPSTQKAEKVTLGQEKDFAEHGYLFYAPLPEQKEQLSSLVKEHFRQNRREWVSVILCILGGGLLNLYAPFAMKLLFDEVLVGHDMGLLNLLTLGLVVSALTSSVFTYTNSIAEIRIKSLVGHQMQPALWYHLIHLSTQFFRKFPAGKLMSDFAYFQGLSQLLVNHGIRFISAMGYSLCYLVLLLYFNVKLTFCVLGVLLIPLLIVLICTWKGAKISTDLNQKTSFLSGLVIQIIQGVGKLRVAGAEKRFFAFWAQNFAEKTALMQRVFRIEFLSSWIQAIFPQLSGAFVISLFLLFLIHGKIEGGSLGSFLGFYSALTPFISNMVAIWGALASAAKLVALWKPAQNLLQQTSEVHLEKVQPRLQGEVSISHLTFRYDPDSPPVLKDVNLVAYPGEMVAITGPSGCGKSTIVRLLLGFEKPELGGVYYDDRPLEDLDLRSTRSQIGTVLQNAGVMGGSIYDNLVGTNVYSKEEVQRAVELSGFDQDLSTFPMGLGTMVPTGGGTLSGGQRQRLFLARALIGAPKVLILDEATSALDNETQDRVSRSLDGLSVTRIVIAHRLSTIRHADRIYVLEQGRVVEVGTYQQLMEKEGLFATMAKRQQM